MSARILVVDDVPANVKLLEAKLTSEYYDVITASNGKDAIRVTKESEPDIVLLDVMMPEMDGFEACRRMKADPKIAHIPVVMVTALSDVQDRVQGLEAGADDFLTKPINDLALFARIRSLVRLKQLTDELRLRDQSGQELGLNEGDSEPDPAALVAGAKILVVDDDVVQAQQLNNKLAPLGANVKILTEPENTLQILNEDDYDLALVSTQMLDLDGLRLCSQIRSHEHTRRLPLLIIIEEDDTNALVKGLDIGVNDYLVTPVDSNEILARVKTQIKRKRYQDALKSNYQKSVSMAVTDALTGLYNRHYFNTHTKNLMNQAKQQGRALSLVISDIDFFKKVNDTYGHIAGDEILKQVPKCMLRCIRATDMVARYGGEEFVIVMPDTPPLIAEDIAERIRKEVEAQLFNISVEPGQIKCTLSMGVATVTPADADPEALLKRADEALYKAKEGGRNRVIVASS